ncbi:hypothetical protein ACT3SZ_14910 [Corynebacterium sp. AOP40-9SA-29]|uniref:hypothetical protein n=1 Tax=Corynebacterium sp. AOP40-9SA-29 TaxID=3457677 RepID=UPI004033636C
MSTAALPSQPSRFLPSKQFLRQSGIYAGFALAIMIVVVWAPLRFVYPDLIEVGEITTAGVGSVVWLVTCMTTFSTIIAGGVLSFGRRASAAPLAGCSVAALVFSFVSLNVPIW